MEAVRIQKWGDNLGINIPPIIAAGLSLREGSYVSVSEIGNRIVIELAKQNNPVNLTSMLNEITEDNIHDCIETGEPLGNEIW
jgi:antitoxin MazE